MSLPNPLTPKPPSIRRRVLAGFGSVLVILAAILVVTWISTDTFLTTAKLVAESRETLEFAEKLMRHIMEMESAHRGFIIVGDKSAQDDFQRAQADISYTFRTLKEKTEDRPEQRVRVDRLELLVSRIMEVEKQEIAARQAGGFKDAAALFAQSKTDAIMQEVRGVVLDFETTEAVLRAERSELTGRIGQAANYVMIVGTTLTFVALGGAGFLILRDVARRQRAEEALAQQANLLSNIMDAMPDHVFLKDTKGRYILDNRSHRLYLGLRATETIEGRTVFDLFPKALAERYHADDLYVLETGAPLRNREEPARPTSRNVAWLSTTKMPLRDPSGRVMGVVCVSSDITARKEADEKLKRFAEKLERSNAELDSFASVASHDLQEPLRKIQAFGDRLRAKCASEIGEQGRDYLARMQNASERMQVLIQDLLKLSRVASRAQPFAPCNLGKIVADVLGDLEVSIEDKHARIELAPLPVIDADPLQMRQLFQNLLANALKFQKPGDSPVVTIGCEIVVATGGEIPGASRGSEICNISVQDNGIGFDQKFADQIFIVFQRLHTRQEYEGTGIGLAVCRKITDRHGGAIVAKSVDGRGATFIVTLPVKQPAQPTHD